MTQEVKAGKQDVQPRVKADLAARRSGGELLAGRGKAGLRDGVVLLVELKGDGVARLRGDIRGLEGQGAAADDDLVVLGSARRCRRSGRGCDARRGGSGTDRGGSRRLGSGITHGGCLESCELVSRVDGEDHALLTVARLATVYPDWFGVGHGELCLLERTVGVVVGHGDTDKRNQTRAGREKGRDTYKPESKPPAAGLQGLSKVDCVAE